MVRPVTMGMLGAKLSGTEESVENLLSERTDYSGSEWFSRMNSPDDVRAHLAACGVDVISGLVTKVGALGDDVALLP